MCELRPLHAHTTITTTTIAHNYHYNLIASPATGMCFTECLARGLCVGCGPTIHIRMSRVATVTHIAELSGIEGGTARAVHLVRSGV